MDLLYQFICDLVRGLLGYKNKTVVASTLNVPYYE